MLRVTVLSIALFFVVSQKWYGIHLPTLRRNDAGSGQFDWRRYGATKNCMDRVPPQSKSLRVESRATAPQMKQ